MSLDLMPGIYHGALVEVVEAEGTGLVGDHALGATVLTVAAGGFRTAGQCRVNGTIYAYVREGDSLAITPALVAAADDGTPVESLTPAGEPETRKLAVVDLDMLGEEDETGDEDANLPRAEIPGEWSGFYPLGTEAAGAIVDVEDTTYGYRVKGRPTDAPLLSGTAIDPATPIPGGQTFSLDAPSDTTGYPEDFGWWQVDADDKVLGFWRLVGGVWTAQEFDIEGALFATNAFIEYLNGKVITGTTVQTRAATDRGIKLGEVSGATNYDEAFIVFNESGVPFLKAVPAEELAVIAGEVKMTTGTVSDGASLGGVTEITRATDGTAGAVRLTGYTTAPKSAPTVTTGYDTVQFDDDGLWANRRGWSTDGTYWYTTRLGASGYIEKWSAAGALIDSNGIGASGVYGVAVHSASDSLYVLTQAAGTYYVRRLLISTFAFATVSTVTWTQNDGTLDPAIGVDSATGDILIAQSRPSNSDKVRIKRYTMPAANLDPLVAGTSVDTAFGYGNDLSGVLYGTHDLGANRYVFSTLGNNTYRVIDTTGAAVSAEDWQSGMGGKVGFTYTGGAFVSMDTTGLMRTYTGQDKATPIGDANLTKWVANTLANATYETDRSPRAKITIPKRTKINVSTSAINTGGANSPDRVKNYVGQGATNPARTAMWKQTDPAVGVTTIAYSSIATSGTNPPATNGFAAAAGTVQRIEYADGTVFVDGIGNGTLIPGTLRDAIDARANAMSAARMQAGTTTSGTLVAATAKTVAVTFPTAFSAAPKVVAGQVGGAGAIVAERRVAVDNVTTTGFDMVFYRATGTAAIDANWIAVKT